MLQAIIDYYRCPEYAVQVELSGELSSGSAFFRFENISCYGRYAKNLSRLHPSPEVENVSVTARDRVLQLPFDLSEVVDNLRLERYIDHSRTRPRRLRDSEVVRRAYYAVRPLLPASFRSYAHKLHLNGWREITFPCWPIDSTVDCLIESTLRLYLQAVPGLQIPFVWFWPQAYPACAVITHDVEDEAGRAFCLDLLKMDESYGIKSSFQIVPEGRYDASADFIDSIASRGFEVNVHDLNHDGHLFKNRRLFVKRASRISAHRERFGAKGFRSGSMYRDADWLSELDFTYDMSVPNAAHLEPQQGGCCTVMPYKLGNLIELPLTVTQDYSLFRILEDYSMSLWEQELEYLIRKHGLINIIVHPDYIIDHRARDLYNILLHRLADLRDQRKIWLPLPREAAQWWNLRRQMRLQRVEGQWVACGEGSENAVVAYAYLDNDRLFYRVGDTCFRVSDEYCLPSEAVRRDLRPNTIREDD